MVRGALKGKLVSRKEKQHQGDQGGGRVDETSVFIRGLPKGTADEDLRTWLEGKVGPTVTCFVIRDDYGLAKFKEVADARRCLEDLQAVEFNGATLRLEAAKPKRPAKGTAATSAAAKRQRSDAKDSEQDEVSRRPPKATKRTPASAASEQDPAPERNLDLRSVQLRNLPSSVKKEAIKSWVELKLPGGCALESVRRALGETMEKNGSTFIVTFRKERNASRAVEALQGAEYEGHLVEASFRALELSQGTSKAGRLIVRNLAFGATKKHVQKVFQKVGTLADVHLPPKPGDATTHRGFAFVQYKEKTHAEKAIAELNGAKVCGRGVVVDWAVEAQLYTSLQQKEQAQQQEGRQGQEKRLEKRPKGVKSDSDVDDDDVENDQDGSEDEEDVGKEKENEDAAGEVGRMKKLLDDEDEEKDDDETEDADEDEDDKTDSKSKKAKDKSMRKPGFDVDEGHTVFVRNVPFDATEAELRDLFKKFGRVKSIKFVADKTGQNAHRGSCFIRFNDTEGANNTLAAESEADRKLKELSAVVRRSDRRELPAVEGFGIALRGRRLVVKQALRPDVVDKQSDEKKDKKSKKEDRREWMHLLNVGRITENSEKWNQLSNSEKRQRAASAKERKYRVNNPNWLIDPLRLSVRNLPRFVNASKLRDAVVQHLGDKLAKQGAAKKEKRTAGEAVIQKVSLVRDSDRRVSGDGSERRSKGFGFIAFKDHQSAMKTLEFLNDNPAIFGGGRRPIVEFAVEDKRKLRMQQELYAKHAHKLKPELKKDAAAKGKVNGRSAGSDKVQGSVDGEHKPQFKKKHKKTESRGRKQREKRRAAKAAEAEKAKGKEVARERFDQMQARRAADKAAEKAFQKRPKKRNIPDAGLPPKNGKAPKRAKVGQLSDDFELRAMESYRR